MKILRPLIATTLAASLAACGGSGDAGTQASGKSEILDRSVTDEMLPYDTVRSQPPLAAPTQAPGEEERKARGGPAAEASPTATGTPAAAETPEAAAPAEAE